MPDRDRAMVRSPSIHHRVHVGERASAGEVRCEPGGWPGTVRALVQRIMYRVRKFHRGSFRDLKYRSQALYQVQAEHGARDATLCREVR